SRLVTEAAHHAGLAKIATGQERFRPTAILYFKLPPDVRPSFIVDVSDVAARRRAAIESYRSQLFDAASREPATYLSQPDFVATIETLHAYYGALIGRRVGEAFLMKGALGVADPVALFRSQAPSALR